MLQHLYSFLFLPFCEHGITVYPKGCCLNITSCCDDSTVACFSQATVLFHSVLYRSRVAPGTDLKHCTCRKTARGETDDGGKAKNLDREKCGAKYTLRNK